MKEELVLITCPVCGAEFSIYDDDETTICNVCDAWLVITDDGEVLEELD